MHAILLHNEKAGGGEGPGADQLLQALREAGHTVAYRSTTEKGARWVMPETPDLVIAAGGDGTVRKAALAVAGRNVPLAILPLGTANNLATTFGLTAPIPETIRNLDTARRKKLDVGVATGPWGRIPFIESAGAGLLATAIFHLSRGRAGESAPSIERGREYLRKLLQDYPAQSWVAEVDGRKFSGNFLLVEAMNTRSAGPNLRLSRNSEPGDGFLDFVFLREGAREDFGRHLEADETGLPPVEIVSGRTLRADVQRTESVHIDDYSWPEKKAENPGGPLSFEIHLTPEPVEVLVPDL